MINSLPEEPKYGFSNFRTKQNVQKRKIGEEFAKREWSVASAGFIDSPTLCFDKKRNLNSFITSLPKKTTNIKSKSNFQSSIISIDSCKSPKKQKQISTTENGPKTNFTTAKRPGSVFLEVQNIKSLFQKNNLSEPKPLVKLSSDFSKKFKAGIYTADIKPQSLLCDGIVVKHSDQINKTKQTKIGCSESINVSSKVRSAHTNISSGDFKAGVKNVNDVTLNYISNIQNSQNFIGSKTKVKISDFSKLVNGTLCLKSDCSVISEVKNLEDEQFMIVDKSPDVSEIDESVLEKAKSNFNDLKNKQRNLSVTNNSVKINRPTEFPKLDKLLKTDALPKKQLSKSNTFENSFMERKLYNASTLQPNSKHDNLPNEILEQENMPKRVKLDKCKFDFPSDLPSPNVACKVKKLCISDLASSVDVKREFKVPIAEMSPKLVTDLMPTTSNLEKFRLSKTHCDNHSLLHDDPSISIDSSRCEMSLGDFSKLLENKSESGKGSSWMQSLLPTLEEVTDDVYHEEPIKKKIRNVLPGGLAEKMQKLQRRENSEKVIWSHKIHRNKKQAQNDSLCFILNSTSSLEDFVIVKASLATQDHLRNLTDVAGNTEEQSSLRFSDSSLLLSKQNATSFQNCFDFDVVFILFKRKAFAKLHLKLNDVFKVYQPWQIVQVKSIPHPLILCAYFIDMISSVQSDIKSETIPLSERKELPMLLKTNIDMETSTHGDLLFFKRGEPLTFSARIQRVWKKEIRARNPKNPLVTSTSIRYSVLLQIREGTFHELRILPEVLSKQWYSVIYQSEGKCFRFHNLVVTHRTSLKRDKYLQNILKALHLQNNSKLDQNFCYQLMFDSSSKCPEEIDSKDLPEYCFLKSEPLQTIFKIKACQRITCTAKVLLQHRDVFYVSDESLLDSSALKYIRVQFLMTAEVRPSLSGHVVLIKEAFVEKGNLLIDNYSQLIEIAEASHQHLLSANEPKVRNPMNICLGNTISFLHMFSEVEHIVFVKGVVSAVDESTAFTWLQCSFCLQENLVQDANLVIYCENCSRIVPSPILNVKLEVVVSCPLLTSATVNVQLLSSTIKKILQIPETTYQPQCSVCDVLDKEIGPLCCYVENRDISVDKTVFHLSEVCIG